jgi:hypothetical protein
MGLMEAQEILDTLKAGGRPEVGERFMEGRILERSEVQRVENERSAVLVADRVDEDHRDKAIAERIEGFAKRLTEAGVTASVITTISSEIKAGFDAKQPLTLDQIKSRLTELGVDVSKLFPVVRPPVSPPPRTEITPPIGLVTRILNRFQVPAATIDIVTKAMTLATEAGKPLTARQILDLLRENGVQIPAGLERWLRR